MDSATPPPALRFLKLLVGTLAAVMIAGILAIVALLFLRLPGPPAPLELPAGFELPDGSRPEAVSFGSDWMIVVTRGGEILVYDRPAGTLRQRMPLRPEPPRD